jgi:hypothetical protein
MEGFTILAHLGWPLLLGFMLQMLILTAVIRGVLAAQQRFLRGNWHVRRELVIFGHVLALFGFAAMTDFVSPNAPASDGLAALLHSVTVLWPVQLLFLAMDLGLRALRTRQTASS